MTRHVAPLFLLLSPLMLGWSSPIVVLTSSSPPAGQLYVRELLLAKGFDVPPPEPIPGNPDQAWVNDKKANTGVIVLPPISISANQASALSAFVSNGGVLIAFKPSSMLDGLLGVSGNTDNSSHEWISIDTLTSEGAGVGHESMRLHGSSRLLTLAGATEVAELRNAPEQTNSPYSAVASRAVGSGHAIAVSIDLANSIAQMRQGNPAWAGLSNNDQRLPGFRPNQMFFQYSGGNSLTRWNSTTSAPSALDPLNDVPQADVLLSLLANLIVRKASPKKPLPMIDIVPAGHEGVLLMTGDQCYSTASEALAAVDFMDDYGTFTTYLWDSYLGTNGPGNVSYVNVNGWRNNGHEVAIHMTYDNGNFNWSDINTRITAALNKFAVDYQGGTGRARCPRREPCARTRGDG